MSDEPQLSEAQLARLADGSATDAERKRLRAQVDASAQLSEQLAEQQRAVSLLRSVDLAAPPGLRARVEGLIDGDAPAQRPDRQPRRAPAGRWRRTLFVPAATAFAIVVAALVILLGSGSTAPTVPQTARLALAAATAPAPPPDHAHPRLLALGVDGIPFPYYESSVGWSAVGSRSQLVHERRIVTVYYRAPDGTRVGYSIVPGGALANPGGTDLMRGGIRYTFNAVGSARYITWQRGGHTCVIAGRTAADATLLRLAETDERTSV